MDREYEIFECLPDGSVLWCARAFGLHNTKLKLDALLRDTGNEYFAMHISTRDLIFAADASKVISERAAKRIFQIAYSDEPRTSRAELLRSLGYPVISVVGNEAAKALLNALRHDTLAIGLFIVGHTAPLKTQNEMIYWLRRQFQGVRILGLNSPDGPTPDADYNAPGNDPQSWLPFVAAAMSPPQVS